MTVFGFKQFRITEKSIPWLFAVLVALAYGLTLFQTGFFWDDWPFAWAAHFMGPESFVGSFLRVRPFLGPIFVLTTSLLPTTPLAWQALALLMRFFLTLAGWWAFRSLWPEGRWQTLLVALCFLVYPAYSQHWVALTHINQELIPFLFYTLSFGMTGLALRSAAGRQRRTTLALLLLILGVFPTEYFISIEPLRLLFIFFILSEQAAGLKTHILGALKTWLPYLGVWGLNALWLYFYYHSGVYANYDVVIGSIAATPGGVLVNFLVASAEAIFKAGLFTWVQLPWLAVQTITAPSTWAALGVAGLALGFLLLFFRRIEADMRFSSSQTWALQAIFMGVAGILLGRIPSWAAGLPLTLQSSFDRFTISMLPGASLLVAGLLTLIFRSKRTWTSAAALVIALGVGQQAYNANIFRRDWERQRDIYWQLSWRIPALKPGTTLLTDQMEIDYETDYSLTAPINWIYAPDFQPAVLEPALSPSLPYLVMGVGERAHRLPSFEPGVDFQFAYRPVRFYGNTAQMVAFIAPTSSCLRILDPVYDSGATLNKPSAVLAQITRLSNPAMILTNAAAPVMPASIFGQEPPHNWCYFYTRAELARQQADWQAIVTLGQEAAQKGLQPSDPLEWLPFIEAQAYTGQIDTAEKLAWQSLQNRPSMRKGICALWARVGQKTTLPDKLLAKFGCQ